MKLSVTTNAELVRQGLENLSLEIPKIGRNQIWKAMQSVLKKRKVYPPKRRNQKYVRTGRLGKGWSIGKADGAKDGYRISNEVPYTKYVAGDAYGGSQAWMHISTDQGKRWDLTRDLVEDEMLTLPQAIQDEIDIVARRERLV